MNGVRFAWNEAKAIENRRKHGVTFEEAVTVFGDENARLMHDPDRPIAEFSALFALSPGQGFS